MVTIFWFDQNAPHNVSGIIDRCKTFSMSLLKSAALWFNIEVDLCKLNYKNGFGLTQILLVFKRNKYSLADC